MLTPGRPAPTLAVAAVLLLVGGCLGQDYLDVELTLSDWEHGWLAVVEPGESFTVGLPVNPAYPDAEWSVSTDGEPVVAMLGANLDRPGDVPEGEPSLTWWLADLVGREVGETALGFTLDSGGETVDRAEFRIAVVTDACANGQGITAPRCGGPQQVTVPQGSADQTVSERENGSIVNLAVDDEFSVVLSGNPARRDAVWRVTGADQAVVTVSGPRELGARSPDNWDTEDDSEPGSFLPREEFTVTGLGPGRTTVRFELSDADRVVESAEFTVEVGSGG